MQGLYPLSELKNYEVDSSDFDVRGWEVISGDNKLIGKINELIVDPEKLKVRYLDIIVNADVEGINKDRHMLIPVGLAELDEKEEQVHVNDIQTVTLLKYPAFEGDKITREYEQSVRKTFVPGYASDDNSSAFYEHPHFNDQNLYMRRRKQLYYLNEVEHHDNMFNIPDLHHWKVYSAGGEKFGKVHDLVIDRYDNKIRYVDVEQEKLLERDDHFLIPVGLITINEDDKSVTISLPGTILEDYPVYDGKNISREYEQRVRQKLDAVKFSNENEFYNHPHFQKYPFAK